MHKRNISPCSRVRWYFCCFHEHGFSCGLAFDSVCKPLKLVAFAVCVSENFAFTVCTRNRVLSGWFPLFDVGSLCATFVCATASPQQQRLNGSATETCMSVSPSVQAERPLMLFPGLCLTSHSKCWDFQKYLNLIESPFPATSNLASNMFGWGQKAT